MISHNERLKVRRRMQRRIRAVVEERRLALVLAPDRPEPAPEPVAPPADPAA